MLSRSAIRSDVIYDLSMRPSVVISIICFSVIMLASVAAPLIAPQNPYDPSQLDLLNSHLPPVFMEGGVWEFPLGSDKQGRDVFSAILYGTRLSLIVSLGAVALSTLVGLLIGILAGYFGGHIDALMMRIAEVQFAFPPLLLALLFNGILRAIMGPEAFAVIAVPVLILAIGAAGWVQYARVVRASTLVERTKDYMLASRIGGYRTTYILRRHLIRNILGPVLVLAMTQVAVAVIYEATLSFLGLGTPLTSPSLGALIQSGSQYLFSGIWWVTIFPGATLLVLLVALTIFGDWLRDVLNPKLR
jgi:peptide/nickel transport system permease protein